MRLRNFLFLLLLSIFALQSFAREGHINVKEAKLYFQTMGKGDPVIVLHGGPGLDQTYLVPQMRKFAKKHEVIFYDQRGSGLSLPVELNERLINPSQFVQDLEDVRKHMGYEKVTLIGHSWGALLAMLYVIDYPQHVKALVLMNAAPIDLAGFSTFFEEYQKRIAPVLPQLEKIARTPEFQEGDQATVNRYMRIIFSRYLYKEDDIDKLNLNLLPTTTKNTTQVMHMMFRDLFDLKPQLSQLTIPALLVHGNNDIVPVSVAEQIAKIIPGAQLAVIKMAGHFSFVEQEDEVFYRMDRFMDSLK